MNREGGAYMGRDKDDISKPKLVWELVKSEFGSWVEVAYGTEIYRSPVPGGWLILSAKKGVSTSISGPNFYPDPDHTWENASPVG
jgi:hypothetical protein